MKSEIKIFISLLLIIITQSCAKSDKLEKEDIINSQNITSSNSHSAQKNIPISTLLRDLFNIINPERDISMYGNHMTNNSSNFICSTVDYHCCNGICLGFPTGAIYASKDGIVCGQSCTIPSDASGNTIDFIGTYGSDPRQKYYVFLPTTVSNINSPIVVLIHGGAWFSGPNLNSNGSFASYSDDPVSANLVRDLRADGYVVVVPLYRLVPYCEDESVIANNSIGFQDQIDDIDACITHIHNNFPNCLYGHPFNANSIQVMGESAGGHLALMYAYTKSDVSYVKSVIDVSAPTNLNQFANYLRNNRRNSPAFSCSGTYSFSVNYAPASFDNQLDFPFFLPVDLTNTNITLASAAPLSCIPSIARSFIYFPPNLTLISQGANTNYAVIDGFKMIESGAKEVNGTPLSSNALQTFSPRFAANAAKNIPTFIMHGSNDNLVRYEFSMDGMDGALAGLGNLKIYTAMNDNIPVPWLAGFRHCRKMYPGLNHVMAGASSTQWTQIRNDIKNWLNGHK